MEFLTKIFGLLVKTFDLFLHLDKYLSAIIADYGTWTYGILLLVIFCETGLVVTPFLPGDSLLFATGTFAAIPESNLSIYFLLLLLSIAAIAGDTLNYWIGFRTGDKAFTIKSRWIKKEYLERTQRFFEKHGGKTIFLARFVPIIRTFAPFVAGIGKMRYGYFIFYNIFGGLTWVFLLTLGGYYFGNLPFVRKNFSMVIIAIIFISFLPIAIEGYKSIKEKKRV